MRYDVKFLGTTLFWAGLLLAGPSTAAELGLPADISTHPDGRMPIEELYHSYLTLLNKGWELDIVTRSQPEGRAFSLPIIALRTRRTGEAAWILSGVHGEEPAGPNAIALSLDEIAALGDLVYMATLDCRVMAFDAQTGRKRWDVEVCDYPTGYALALWNVRWAGTFPSFVTQRG